MNRKKINRQRILRHRRRGTTPTVIMTLPTGAHVEVTRSPLSAQRASYRTRNAQVFGVWPPAPVVIKELARWS